MGGFVLLGLTNTEMLTLIRSWINSPKQSLVEYQIVVYLAWIRRHHRWDILSDEEWIRMFVTSTKIDDIHDATEKDLLRFFETVRTSSHTDLYPNAGKRAVGRFMRFYRARTKSFTERPRYVALFSDASLSTEKTVQV